MCPPIIGRWNRISHYTYFSAKWGVHFRIPPKLLRHADAPDGVLQAT
jgi:hypothetical protein